MDKQRLYELVLENELLKQQLVDAQNEAKKVREMYQRSLDEKDVLKQYVAKMRLDRVQVIKRRRAMPTVILYQDRQYVFDSGRNHEKSLNLSGVSSDTTERVIQ